MRAHAVEREDRPLRVGDPDVHVQREGRLTLRERAHRAVHLAVAAGTPHHRVLPDGERVQAAARRRQPHLRQLRAQPPTRRPQLGGDLCRRAVHPGAELERRTVGLAGGVIDQAGRQRSVHLLERLGQRPVARMQQHHLLLRPSV
ncbi:MAG TPA: hypothetical protein VKA57_00050 [Solirubrobacteraceae bacterium]|nr:hypothetical protein [Solirubrobacteraceae bacterium]